MKILNLYAGIGGNRKLWGDEHEITVVEYDEKIARQNLKHVLSKEGYVVTTAASGQEGLELLQKKRFAVVITDLKMQDVDGMEVLEKAKAIDPNVVVIMISGYATTRLHKSPVAIWHA